VTVQTASTRLVDTKPVPQAGTYVIDTAHSTVEAVARHLMVTKVRGRFTEFSGQITVAEDVTASTVEVDIDAASITTASADRDAHLRSPDFLDVETYPTLRFRSTGVTPAGDGWRLAGDLTIRGVTRPVVLDMAFLGSSVDPWGSSKVSFSATTEIDREDFGMTWNQGLEAGGVLVGKSLKIEIEIQAAA
jgi:polyisoprenoid-binding protein YceI